jgi:hypothetical protein
MNERRRAAQRGACAAATLLQRAREATQPHRARAHSSMAVCRAWMPLTISVLLSGMNWRRMTLRASCESRQAGGRSERAAAEAHAGPTCAAMPPKMAAIVCTSAPPMRTLCGGASANTPACELRAAQGRRRAHISSVHCRNGGARTLSSWYIFSATSNRSSLSCARSCSVARRALTGRGGRAGRPCQARPAWCRAAATAHEQSVRRLAG